MQLLSINPYFADSSEILLIGKGLGDCKYKEERTLFSLIFMFLEAFS